jgi:hypothetical protein
MNKAKLERFEHWLSLISEDFDRCLLDDPDFASDMRPGSYVLFQLEVEGLTDARLLADVQGFNSWLKELAAQQKDTGQPLYVATVHVQYKPTSPQPFILERFPRDFELAHQR